MFHDVSRKIETITCKIEWKIYDLKKYQEFMKHVKFLSSKQFYNPRCPSVVFEMRVYLENSFSYPTAFSLIQKGMPDLTEPLIVKYSIYALDANCKRVDFISTFCDFKKLTETEKYTFNAKNILHPDGSILLYCETEFVPHNIKCEPNILFDDFSITNISQKHFVHKQGILTDCFIKCGNEQINTHRCVLAHNSVVFQKMFEQAEMIEAKNGEVNIIDSSPECVRTMIEYFYSGEINKEILEKLAYELYAIAHKYEIKSLMDICEHMMSMKIDTNNFTKYVYYLQLYKLPILEEACVKFIASIERLFYMEKNGRLQKTFIRIRSFLCLNQS
ncbi:BTB domain-containing protein [Meloidogyne graminicola]|uniref:BTB domain-containing protein n=1 Tax=Meloidogyne graminicola TaxID=189291 RepID=A0A8S9ZTB1_9BILA|nr:BTB domain-containing protein [Meloidogyne graminicola]